MHVMPLVVINLIQSLFNTFVSINPYII